MDINDIENLVNQTHDDYPWASEITMNRIAAAADGHINVATLSEYIRSSKSTKNTTTSVMDELRKDLQKLKANEQVNFDELNDIISDTFKDAFRPGSLRDLYDASQNTKLVDAAREIEGTLGKRTAAATQAASGNSSGGKARYGFYALAAYAQKLNIAAWMVKAAALVVTRAINKKEMLNPMIERGMTVSEVGTIQAIDQLKHYAKTSFGGFESMMQSMDIALGSLTQLSGSSFSGGLNFGFMMEQIAANTDLNYGYTFDDLAKFHAQEIDLLYELGMVENIRQLSSQNYIDTFDMAQKMALGMASATGADRRRLLDERVQYQKSLDFAGAFASSVEYYTEQLGVAGANNVRESATQLKTLMDQLGLESLSREAMDVVHRGIANIDKTTNIRASASPEFLAMVNQMPNGDEFLSILEDVISGDKTAIDVNKRASAYLLQVFDQAELQASQKEGAVTKSNIVLSEIIAGGRDRILRMLKVSDETELAKLREELEASDSSADAANAMSKIKGNISSYTDLSMRISIGLSDVWGAIMRFLNNMSVTDMMAVKGKLGIGAGMLTGLENTDEITILEEAARELGRGVINLRYGQYFGGTMPDTELLMMPTEPTEPDTKKPAVVPPPATPPTPAKPKEQPEPKKKETAQQESKAKPSIAPFVETGETEQSKPSPKFLPQTKPKSKPMPRPEPINVTEEAKARQQAAMDFFIEKGLTPAQAAGLVGNFMVESFHDLRTDAVGDGGKAFGIAQWRYDKAAGARAKTFEEQYGKHVKDASFEEQLEYVMWEFENTHYKRAFSELKQATTPEEAAFIVDDKYEQSNGKSLNKRQMNAFNVLNDYQARVKSGAKSPSTAQPKSSNFDMESANARMAELKAQRAKANKGAITISKDQEEYIAKVKDYDEQIRQLQEKISEHVRRNNTGN